LTDDDFGSLDELYQSSKNAELLSDRDMATPGDSAASNQEHQHR
jgi:hypothetical protein